MLFVVSIDNISIEKRLKKLRTDSTQSRQYHTRPVFFVYLGVSLQQVRFTQALFSLINYYCNHLQISQNFGTCTMMNK